MKPPLLNELKNGHQLIAGLGHSTILPEMDFETYSPAGFQWNGKSFGSLPGVSKRGIKAVGMTVYTEHKLAEILSLAYNLKNGQGIKTWKPGDNLPFDLFTYLHDGGLIEAWNSMFEFLVWNNIGVKKYGFPELKLSQLRDAAAKSRAYALPSSLDDAGNVLNISLKKDKEGKRLITKFTMPRTPTKADPRFRILMEDEPLDAQKFIQYNMRDTEAESELSSKIPDLTKDELEFWKVDQIINQRGVHIDVDSVNTAIKIIEAARDKYNAELSQITEKKVTAASQTKKIIKWINHTTCDRIINLKAETVKEYLQNPELPKSIRRVLEIRQLLGSAAVKKLYAMRAQVAKDNRLHNLFIYHAARTGRAAGASVQPHNFPRGGLVVFKCGCGRHYKGRRSCPWCGQTDPRKAVEWKFKAVEDALETIAVGSLEYVEAFWGEAIPVVSGCLRGLITAAPGHDLICSDYSAIEAVVLAALAGEEWRLEVFRTHGKIYEMSASKITGISFEEFELHKKLTGEHHPLRSKVGKVAELASGYQGWIGAWRQFGADEFFSDDEIKEAVLAWRAASPRIVKFWRDLETAAINAMLYPGKEFKIIINVKNEDYITYLMYGDALYCQLPSGRYLTYHRPRLADQQPPRKGLQLTFEGWNTNAKYGKAGWVRMSTYGGKLTENVVQAVARDILAHAIVKLESLHYPVVLHVHDEIVCEVKEDFGTIETLEQIMMMLPEWAKGWPIKAVNGWRGKRYRK